MRSSTHFPVLSNMYDGTYNYDFRQRKSKRRQHIPTTTTRSAILGHFVGYASHSYQNGCRKSPRLIKCTYDGADDFFGCDRRKHVFNLRFPGQYFDKETGTHYNYYRDYDPSIGRYIQSDPIGLTAGPNTYSYVGGNPLTYFDPQGKAAQALGCLAGAWAGPIGCGAGAAVVTIVGGALLMNAVGSDSQPSPYDPAANDPKYGSCGPDCPGQRAILNRMFHVIDGYAHSPTANPSVVASYWLGFKMQVKRYEKECGPYTPPPSISDIYLK
jgi:RHS repeat-associated protein